MASYPQNLANCNEPVVPVESYDYINHNKNPQISNFAKKEKNINPRKMHEEIPVTMSYITSVRATFPELVYEVIEMSCFQRQGTGTEDGGWNSDRGWSSCDN